MTPQGPAAYGYYYIGACSSGCARDHSPSIWRLYRGPEFWNLAVGTIRLAIIHAPTSANFSQIGPGADTVNLWTATS